MSTKQKIAAFLTSPTMQDGTIAYVQRGRTVRLESAHQDRVLRACECAQRIGAIVSHPMPLANGQLVMMVTF